MKAIVYEGFGSPDILRCQELEKPAPRENEVLIKVRAASINPLDWK
jgi:NADPH:quinone reductase-like Zn-dependent oxidoreductase